VSLEVFGETATAADPGEGALYDPTLGQNDEAVQLAASDDLKLPGARLGDRGSSFRRLIASVGEDAFYERAETAGAPIEYQPRTVAILDIRRVNDDIQQEAERVDQYVPLATLDLLARVIARRVERRPPFCAPLTL
jgi:hypothetical protein